MKITELKDQLNAIGDSIENKDLVMLAMNGLPHSWESFIQGISRRNELPKFDRLRADRIQEECRLEVRGFGRKSHHEEDYVLTAHTSKRRGRKGNFKRNRDRNFDSAPESKKRKDLSRVQCFRCDKFGHFARECPSGPKPQAAATNVENVSPRRESSENSEGFLFISALSGSIPIDSDTWLIDSGASSHITGYREHLPNLKEKDSHLQVIIGDDAC